ncbi:MAG: hypothetical protein ACR5LB_11600 [Wolbachia sp.]
MPRLLKSGSKYLKEFYYSLVEIYEQQYLRESSDNILALLLS